MKDNHVASATCLCLALIFPFGAYGAVDYCNGLLVTVDLAKSQSTTNGDDVIKGTMGPDVINARNGNDTICSLGGDDIIKAGGGHDWVDGGSGSDRIEGGGGDDFLRAGSGDDRIWGGAGDDTVHGVNGANTIILNSGNDVAFGGIGPDVIRGGGGSDELYGGSGNDSIFGGNDDDHIYGEVGNDELRAGAGTDFLYGGRGNDLLNGQSGANELYGGDGSDYLIGGSGPDILDGGEGLNDVCEASGENDILRNGCENLEGIDLNDYELVFSDDFEGSELDDGKWATGLLWGPYLSINNEEQMYIDTLGMHSDFAEFSPFEISGGTLKITAASTSGQLSPPERPPEPPVNRAYPSRWRPYKWAEYSYNGSVSDPETGEEVDPGYQADDVNYLSGLISSYGTFKTTHGYVEINAKLPAGRGLWPAFWLLPTHYVDKVPEIDVMEFLGHDVSRTYHTYHYFDVADNWRLISTPSHQSIGDDWTVGFHRFGMSWTPNSITWYVDGDEVAKVEEPEYDIARQAMYLIANLAVGGNWPGSPDHTTEFPAVFEIDYIRAYKKKLLDPIDLDSDYQLVFNDEFSGAELDRTKWNTHFLWGPYLPINNEEQFYVDALGSHGDAGVRSPFSVGNGVLSITARAADDPDSYPIPPSLPDVNDSVWSDFPTFQRYAGYTPQNYTSGMITSYDSFKFVNGYAEIRARVPEGDGLWPAFWLLNAFYVGREPEIDIMEMRGENPQHIVHSYHRRDEDGNMQSYSSFTDSGGPEFGYSGAFHTFGVSWRMGEITWYIDGVAVEEYEGDDVSYQLMYVIANLAVGGDFNYRDVDESLFPISLDIDYIRVYQGKD